MTYGLQNNNILVYIGSCFFLMKTICLQRRNKLTLKVRFNFTRKYKMLSCYSVIYFIHPFGYLKMVYCFL